MEMLTRSTKKIATIKVIQTTRTQRRREGAREFIRRCAAASVDIVRKLDSIPWFGQDGNSEARGGGALPMHTVRSVRRFIRQQKLAVQGGMMKKDSARRSFLRMASAAVGDRVSGADDQT